MEQKEIYRRMTPAQRLRVASKFYNDAKSLKRAALALQHPEWTSCEVDEKVKELFLSGTR